MTNVNPGNRDPRKGRFGGARKFFSRDKGEDLLQDRDDLADDLVQEPASDHYETAGDGSFDEALDEYYDARDEYDPRADRTERTDRADRVASTRETAADRTASDVTVEREPVARGKHHRREEVDSDGYGYSHGYETDSDGYGYTHGETSRGDGYGYAHGHKASATGADPAERELEPGDYIDGENNYGYTSKAAAYDDRADYDDYGQVDDRADYVDEEDDDRAVAAAGAGAAGAGAAAAGTGAAAAREDAPRKREAGAAGAAGAGSSTAAAAGGVPKRGLAMILIAVALLLALWGVYSMTKGGSDDQAANDPASQSAQNQAGQDAQGQNGQNGTNQNGAAQGQNANDPNAQNGQNPNDPNAQNGQNANDADAQNRQPGDTNAQADNNAPAGPNNPMTRENQTVNVYNNSAMLGLADQVAAQARGKGINVGEVDNIPGESAIFEQNTVLFDPATPGAEDRARELADQVGGIALANDDRVPAEAKKPGSLTLVLAENREVTL